MGQQGRRSVGQHATRKVVKPVDESWLTMKEELVASCSKMHRKYTDIRTGSCFMVNVLRGVAGLGQRAVPHIKDFHVWWSPTLREVRCFEEA